MPDEKKRRYLFVAIDRAARWAHMGVCSHKTAASFLAGGIKRAPFKIYKWLAEYTDKLFTANKDRAPTVWWNDSAVYLGILKDTAFDNRAHLEVS